MRSSWLLVVAVVGSMGSACAEEGGVETDDLEVGEEDAKTDSASELRLRVADTTLWLDRAVVRRGDLFVLGGRTSRNLTDGNAFIFDDVYGDFLQRSARTFEVSWPVSTARGVVDGVNLFTSLGFAPSSGRPDRLTSRVVVRPRLGAVTGASALALTAELTPVIVAGRIVYRVKGRSTQPITALIASTGVARLVDATHFEVDLDYAQLDTLTAGAPLAVQATLPAGPAMIRGTLGLAIKLMGLTAGDVETVFPSPTCTAERRSCLLALPDGALDLGSCGPALLVQACRPGLGVVIDQGAVLGVL
ncbi:MAG: hypothetical protein H0X17_10700, partial [Deltaproteobacteria bacterium]|nr:hypothetical protein [Deltaproteobacteria bacterium]